VLAGAAALVCAFKDTSPFILLSSDSSIAHLLPSSSSSSDDHLQSVLSSNTFLSIARGLVAECPADTYLLVSQPGLHASDFSTKGAEPHLQRMVADAQGSLSVPYGLGAVDLDNVQEYARENCGAQLVVADALRHSFPVLNLTLPVVVRLDFAELPGDMDERQAAMADNDAFLYSLVSSLPSSSKYTLVYTSTPVSSDEQPVVRRRSMVFAQDGPAANSTSGLFAHYQFFTPGIFMGILAVVILGSIAGVAVSAIASLEIPYQAFSKDVVHKKDKAQ